LIDIQASRFSLTRGTGSFKKSQKRERSSTGLQYHLHLALSVQYQGIKRGVRQAVLERRSRAVHEIPGEKSGETQSVRYVFTSKEAFDRRCNVMIHSIQYPRTLKENYFVLSSTLGSLKHSHMHLVFEDGKQSFLSTEHTMPAKNQIEETFRANSGTIS
jgi:hypothetical protein